MNIWTAMIFPIIVSIKTQACLTVWSDTGEKQPTLENLVILCDYLNVSIDYLVGNISAREEKLLHYYRCLSPEKKDEADTYMNNSAIDT